MSPSASKIWLITGCSAGFGYALARAVQAHGHKVIASSRNPSKSSDLVKEITDKGGHWIPLDVTAKDVKQTIEKAEAIYGHLDVVVNNAGYSYVGAIEDLDEEGARAQMDANFFGPFKVIQAVLPSMRARRSGTIVNVTSIGGLRAMPTAGLYGSSKHALEGLSESLAAEVADFGIRVLIVEPGAFRTNFLGQGAVTYVPLSDAYKGTTADKLMQCLENSNGKQLGDPNKGAERIFEVVMGEGMAEGKKQHLRLPLGSDCIRNARAKFDMLREAFDDYEEIAVSTDYKE